MSIIIARPTKPHEVYGSIRVIDNAILSVINWNSPPNKNETVIDYYDVMLIKNHSNNTNSVRVAASVPTPSYKYTVLEGNYTAVSITAVDLCGQRSEPSQVKLMVNIANKTVINSIPYDWQKSTMDGLIGGLAAAIAVIIVFCIVIVTIVVIKFIGTQKKTDSAEYIV